MLKVLDVNKISKWKKSELRPKDWASTLPFYSCSVAAGFPSPAESWIEGGIDLNKYLIKHPASTFLFRMHGEAMIDSGIFPDNILIVDRSLTPVNGKIVIAEYEGKLWARRFYQEINIITLLGSKDKRCFFLTDHDASGVSIWGVVTAAIHFL